MQVQGKIISLLPKQSGINKAGNPWEKQEFVIETQDQYPKKIAMGIFGADKIAAVNPQVGQQVVAEIDIESREYNGKWFTNINCWKLTQAQQEAAAPQQSAAVQQVAAAFNAQPVTNQAQRGDDLPF